MGVSHWLGWFYSKVGRRCNKALFLKPLGGKKYLLVKEQFFRDTDEYIHYAKGKSTSVKPYPCCITKKQENWGFFDYETGAVLNFSGMVVHGVKPEVMSEELKAKDVAVVTQRDVGSDVVTLVLVAGFGVFASGIGLFFRLYISMFCFHFLFLVMFICVVLFKCCYGVA